jgi:glycosyltransferase involved in cell wall biosynthesis
MTYLYYTTVKGLPAVKDKAVLIPTAHDEAPVYLKTFREIFNMPRGIFYLTHEECEFTQKLFNNSNIINNNGYGGSGIEIPDSVNADFIKDKYGIEDYIVYAGRIDVSKGCKELFKYFKKYKRHNKNNLKLVLIGKEVMKVPHNSNIVSLGFVSEQEKYDVMAGARALIMPSAFESLSIVVLEALGLGIPVICNGKCDVLKGHCKRSGAGIAYEDYRQFEAAINRVINEIGSDEDLCRTIRKNAMEYVRNNYTWDIIMKRFNEVIEACARKENI